MAVFNQDWRGDRIEFLKEGTVARRTASYNGGIVYSSEPIEINEVFQVRVDAMEMGWAGSLKFGVTIRCPAEQAVPKGILELYNRDDFWVLSGDKIHHDHKEQMYPGPSLESLTRGDTVGLYVNSDGELHFLLKGVDHGVKSIDIPVDRDIYVVADIYGQVKQISMDESVSVVHDTPMAEIEMSSRKSAYAPAASSSLTAAKALRAVAGPRVVAAAAASPAPSPEKSWKIYVNQQALLQRELLEHDPALAELHRHHLASLFGTRLGQASAIQATDVQRLVAEFKSRLRQVDHTSETAGSEEEPLSSSSSGECETTG